MDHQPSLEITHAHIAEALAAERADFFDSVDLIAAMKDWRYLFRLVVTRERSERAVTRYLLETGQLQAFGVTKSTDGHPQEIADLVYRVEPDGRVILGRRGGAEESPSASAAA